MKQKHMVIMLIIMSIVIAGFVYNAKLQEDKYISGFINETGSCYLSDNTCLHDDRSYTGYIIGGIVAGIIFALGVYLYFFDQTQEQLLEHQEKVSKALEQAKKHEKEKDEFKAFLAGFSQDEQKILKAVKAQEGIKQSTLRFKTGFSKTTLSLMLKSLEERKIISKKKDSKSNRIYLVDKY